MSRRSDRKHAFGLIYQLEFHNDLDAAQCLLLYFDENLKLDEIGEPYELPEADDADIDFIRAEFEGVIKNKAAIDDLIGKNAAGWDFDRLSKIDLAILRLAVFELMSGVTKNIIINEAVELAKRFSTDDAHVFINGVLASVAVELDKNPLPAANSIATGE